MSEMLANQYFISGRYRDAGALLEGLVREHPEVPVLWRKLALCREETGALAAALEAAAAAMEGADEAPPWTDVDADEAHRLLAATDGDGVETWNRRALLALWSDADSACACLRRSLAAEANQPAVRRLLAALEGRAPGRGSGERTDAALRHREGPGDEGPATRPSQGEVM